MKSRNFSLFRFHATITVALFTHVAAPSASAQALYWDNNGTMAGFGASTGTTWSSAATLWSASAAGTDAVSGALASTTADTVNFGTGALGLATGTITVSGTVQAGNVTVDDNSGSITLSGGTINLGSAATINTGGKVNTINSKLSGAATGLTFSGGGTTIFTDSGAAGFGAGLNATVSNTTLRFSSGGDGALGGATGFNINLGTATTGGTLHVGNSIEVKNNITVVAGTGTRTIGNSGNPSGTYSGNITANENLAISWSSSNPSTFSGPVSAIATGKTVTFTASSSGSVVNSAIWGGLGNIAYAGSSTGSITASGAKTYSGSTTLGTMSGTGAVVVSTNSSGPANAPTAGGFGTGTLTIGNTKVRATTTADITVGNPITFTNSPTFPTIASEKSLIFTGNADLGAASRTLTVNVGSTVSGKVVDFQGIISSATPASGITKAGTGALTLSGASTFTGATDLTGGTLNLSGGGSVNNSSGITVNGSGAKLLHTSSIAVTPAITLTQGTLTGNGTLGAVNVGAGTGGIISNNDGVAGASLTTGALTFSGAATVSTFVSSASAPIVTASLASNAAGTVTVNASSTIWADNTTYDLISYGGGSIGGGGFGQFALGSVTGLSARQSATVLGNSGTAITMTVAGDSPYWTGTTDSKWNTTTANNWNLLSNNSGVLFLVSDNVIFNDSATGVSPVSVDIDLANVTPNSTTFNNPAKDYVLGSTGGFGISSGFLTKSGNGRLTITNANTFSGGTTVNGGTLVLGNANAISTGTLTLNGGNLDSSVVNLVNAGNNAQAWNSNFTFVGTENLNLGAGAVTMSGDRTVTVSAKSLTVGGVIGGGAVGLTKAGAGTLVLTQINAYTGSTTISGGTLQLGDGVGPNGSVAGSIVNNAALVIANSATQTIANTISGSGTLTKPNAAALTLSGINTYTGTTAISGGTLTLGSSSALGGTSGLTLGGALAATLSTTTTGITIAAPITTANTGVTSTIAFSRATPDAGTITLNGALGGNGNVSFTTPNVNSGGNLQNINLGTASNYAGTTTLNTANINNNLTLRNASGAANALPTTTVFNFGSGAGTGSVGRTTTYDLGSQNQTIAGLSNGGVVPNSRLQRVSSTAAAALTINNSSDFTFGGATLSGGLTTRAQITGAISLIKNGAGTFTLGGTLTGGATAGGNTYTGTTQILGGILVLGETASIQNSALDTTASVMGDTANGLRTTVTTLTMGGLIGNKDLASLFETATGGYSSVTALTLNPATGATPSYSAVIADGATGMTLTKSGAGTQTLSGANTYTGATAVTAGTLALGASNVLPDTAVSIGNATLDAATFSDTLGTLDVTSTGKINLGAGGSLAFAAGSPAWTGTLAITGTFISGASLKFGNDSTGLSALQLAAISKPGFSAFALDGNGFLTATAVGGYSAWAAINASSTTPAQDQDGDGVNNAAEYVLGGTVTTNDLSKLPAVSTAGANLVFTFKRDQASIDGTTLLTIQVGTTLLTWPVSYSVPGPAQAIVPGVTIDKDTTPGFDTVTLSIPRTPDAAKFARLNVVVTP